MSIPDSLMWEWYILLTDLEAEIPPAAWSGRAAPPKGINEVARRLVTDHGAAAAEAEAGSSGSSPAAGCAVPEIAPPAASRSSPARRAGLAPNRSRHDGSSAGAVTIDGERAAPLAPSPRAPAVPRQVGKRRFAPSPSRRLNRHVHRRGTAGPSRAPASARSRRSRARSRRGSRRSSASTGRRSYAAQIRCATCGGRGAGTGRLRGSRPRRPCLPTVRSRRYARAGGVELPPPLFSSSPDSSASVSGPTPGSARSAAALCALGAARPGPRRPTAARLETAAAPPATISSTFMAARR